MTFISEQDDRKLCAKMLLPSTFTVVQQHISLQCVILQKINVRSQLNSYFFLAAFLICLYNLFLTVHLGPFCVVSKIIRNNLLNSFLSLLDSNHVTSYSYLWAQNITFLILRIFVVSLHFSTSNWSFGSVCRPSHFLLFSYVCQGLSF